MTQRKERSICIWITNIPIPTPTSIPMTVTPIAMPMPMSTAMPMRPTIMSIMTMTTAIITTPIARRLPAPPAAAAVSIAPRKN